MRKILDFVEAQAEPTPAPEPGQVFTFSGGPQETPEPLNGPPGLPEHSRLNGWALLDDPLPIDSTPQ